MNINFLDVIILCILSFFAIRGLMHGFVAEILGLIGIFGGIYLAKNYYANVASYINFVEDPLYKSLAAYIMIFIVVMIGVKLLHSILEKVINFSFVGWIDSLGGFIIGCVKGLLLCTIMLVFVDTFSPNAELLEQSYIVPYLDKILTFAKDYIPLNLLDEPTV